MLVSYSGVRYGMSADMLGLAITIVIAPTGQASAHRLWPIHLYPLTRTALPPNMASTSPSGHTCVQIAQPMHHTLSICGCWAWGPLEYVFPFSSDARARASLFFKWFWYTRKGIAIAIAQIA